MYKSLEEMESDLAAQEQVSQELRDHISRERASRAMVRKAAASRAAKDILERCKDDDMVLLVHEGELECYEDLPSDYGNEIVVTLESAYARKEYISTHNKLDEWNKSYQDYECVKMSVYIPRAYLEQSGTLPRFREEINGTD